MNHSIDREGLFTRKKNRKFFSIERCVYRNKGSYLLWTEGLFRLQGEARVRLRTYPKINGRWSPSVRKVRQGSAAGCGVWLEARPSERHPSGLKRGPRHLISLSLAARYTEPPPPPKGLSTPRNLGLFYLRTYLRLQGHLLFSLQAVLYSNEYSPLYCEKPNWKSRAVIDLRFTTYWWWFREIVVVKIRGRIVW